MDLLQRYDPSGLLLVSGDVHHAEISAASVLLTNGNITKYLFQHPYVFYYFDYACYFFKLFKYVVVFKQTSRSDEQWANSHVCRRHATSDLVSVDAKLFHATSSQVY